MKSRAKNISENSLPRTAWKEINELIVHKDISLNSEYVIRLKRTDARSDEDQEIEVDLRDAVLPPNSVHAQSISLASRLDFVAAIVLAADALLKNCSDAKSRGNHVQQSIHAQIKFFEFVWLRDKFRLSDLTGEDFGDFAKILAKGGWVEALNIEDRLRSAITADSDLIRELVNRKGKSKLHVNRNGLKRVVGSNLHPNEINDYLRQIVAESLDDDSFRSANFFGKTPKPMGASTLTQILGSLNYLFDLPNACGLNYVPYPDNRRLARLLGVPPTVTKNMGIAEATAIVDQAYKWLYEYGDDIVTLIAGACAEVKAAHQKKRKIKGQHLDRWLASSTIARGLEHKIGVKIVGVDSPRLKREAVLTLRDLLLLFFTACFNLVAMMNARRKDEIIHPKYGLHYGFTIVVDEELAIYQGNFYLEKTLQDYLEFYVNKTTRDVALYLEKIQDCFDEVNVELGRPPQSEKLWSERSLFSYQRFSKANGLSETINTYIYGPTDPQNAGYKFQRLALKSDFLVAPHPHMFRRMYSLIFMYQHEIPSMLALKQQLAHDSLKSTQMYLNDPVSRDERERIGRKLGVPAQRRAEIFAFHLRDVQEEIDLVRDEKLVEIILSIIEGQPTSGGYPKFIKKFYSRISKNVDFSQLKNESAAKEVARIVSAKGHSPNPTREGTCMAGGLRRSSASRCRDDDGVLRKENAGVTLCGTCAFGFLTEAYVSNLEEDLSSSERRLQSGLLQGIEEKRTVIDIANLKSMIGYHRGRLVQSRPIA